MSPTSYLTAPPRVEWIAQDSDRRAGPQPCDTSGVDSWEPDQYDRFARERRQPWDDLLALCRPVPGGTAADLGCGTGRLTVELPERLQLTSVVGIDSSPAMLGEARQLASSAVRFERGDLTEFAPAQPVDLIVANASLQWAANHDRIMAKWCHALAPGGQLAVQVPANGDHPANALIAELSEELADWFPTGPPPLVTDSVLTPERYATMLWNLGASEQWVALRVYPHELEDTAEVVEWLKGTTLTRVRKELHDDDRYGAFVEQLTDRVLERLGDHRPFLYTFKRILFWARFEAGVSPDPPA
jgi:trans-aconitate 2-methyltransferase